MIDGLQAQYAGERGEKGGCGVDTRRRQRDRKVQEPSTITTQSMPITSHGDEEFARKLHEAGGAAVIDDDDEEEYHHNGRAGLRESKDEILYDRDDGQDEPAGYILNTVHIQLISAFIINSGRCIQ